MARRGFTLLEVLIAISILVVIVAVVYASFASVTDTMAVARVRTEEMRLRQFLERSFRTNLSSVYVDPGYEQQVFQFIGLNDENTQGPRDSLRFVSTNTLIGGSALPGDYKEVRYEVLGGEQGRLGADFFDDGEQAAVASGADPQQATLEATETPLLASNAQAVDESGNLDVDETATITPVDAPMYEAPSWSVPIRTLDFLYYDGTEWVEEWDSQVLGKLPWCVQVRINFARTEAEIEAEREQNIDIFESPDFECVIPLPIALGVQTDGRTRSAMEEAAAEAEENADTAGGAPQNTTGREDSSAERPSPNTSSRGRTGISGRSGAGGRSGFNLRRGGSDE